MSEDPLTYGLWLHPHAPAAVSRGRPRGVHWAYHHDADPADFHRVATVSYAPGHSISGPRLHRYGIVADRSKQFYGWGGPWLFYADFTRTCATCGEDFVFTAEAQRFWYEELGSFCDRAARRCQACRKAARDDRRAQRHWTEALDAWDPTTPDRAVALELAEAAVALVDGGGGTRRVLDQAVGALRKAARHHPGDPLIQGWLARIDLRRGRADEALTLGDQVLETAGKLERNDLRDLARALARDLAPVRRARRIP